MKTLIDYVHSFSWVLNNNYGITRTSLEDIAIMFRIDIRALENNIYGEGYRYHPKIEMWIKEGYTDRGIPK